VPEAEPEKVFVFDPARPPSEIPSVAAFRLAPDLVMEFCWVPAGRFTMGSPPHEHGRQDNEAQVPVQISRGFWMGRREVTGPQWRAVRGKPIAGGDEKTPVVSVSWEDCRSFISRLSAPIAGWRVDLPTEAQWEYACRAGTQGAFAGEPDAMAWHFENTNVRSQAVGLKHPNAWGLHDMHGNVFEWCRDAYRERLRGGTNPYLLGSPENILRVRRGGSWFFKKNAARSACRLGEHLEFKTSHLGFRLALLPEGL